MKFFDELKIWKKDKTEKILLKRHYKNIFFLILPIIFFPVLALISLFLGILTLSLIIDLQTNILYLFILVVTFIFLIFYVYNTIIFFRKVLEIIYINYWYRKNLNKRFDILIEFLENFLHIEHLKEKNIYMIKDASVFLFDEIVKDDIKKNYVANNVIEIYNFIRHVLNKELPTLLSFNQQINTNEVSVEIQNLINKLKSKRKIKDIYKNILKIHNLYLKHFDMKFNVKEHFLSNSISKVLYNNKTIIATLIPLILFILYYMSSFLLLNNIDSSNIEELEIIDGNITQYEYTIFIENKGLLNIENFDISLPSQPYESSLGYSSSVEGCKIIDGGENIHCDKIYRNGILEISWKSKNQMFENSNQILFYQTSINLLPFFILPDISYKGAKNIIPNSSICPSNYTFSDGICKPNGIIIHEIFPIRNSFYSNSSVALIRFVLYGAEKGIYTFITKWYNSSHILYTNKPIEDSLEPSKLWGYWYYTPTGNNETWTFSLELIWAENKTEANTTFQIIKNDSLVPFFSSSSCILLNYSSNNINHTINLISWNSRDEISQSNDILSWVRRKNILSSYNSTLLFTSKSRLLGIPTKIVKGQSEIGTEHFWAEIYSNNTWIPVDVSTDYPIGKYSNMYNNNITVLLC